MEFFNDVGSDPLKPSLFELVAQEQLRDLLQPALKYLRNNIHAISCVSSTGMRNFTLLSCYSWKGITSGNIANASFSENFYGLKRRRRPFIETERVKAAVGGIPPGEKLRAQEIWRSLLFLVGVPYLRAKAQDYYEELGGDASLDIDGPRVPRDLGSWRRIFRAVYPWLNTSFELWLLVCNIAYLFGKTPFYRPWLSWIGIDLRRLGAEDFRATAAANNSPSGPRTPLAIIRRLLLASPQALFESLRLLLPTAIFFVKFLEWWYSPGSPARSFSTSPAWTSGPSATYAPSSSSGYPLPPTELRQMPHLLGRTMKFGKHIQAQQVPGWSAHYLDYKFLKKIISSLTARRPASEAAALALGLRPADILASSPSASSVLRAQPPIVLDEPVLPPLFSASVRDERGPDFQAHKAAFFFKLERELEKVCFLLAFISRLDSIFLLLVFQINEFYLQKEAELKLRLETLLSKRRAAAMRGFPDTFDDTTQNNNVEWTAVEEGFRILERDLVKLQQFVEINATGFRKILKKFDKRSTSTTKELYLARQVDVQPVFNRQLISELSDTVAACLLDLTDLSSGLKFEGSAATDIFAQQIMNERPQQTGPFHDLENNLRKAVATSDNSSIADCIHYSDGLSQQGPGGKTNVTRILWNAIIEAPPELANLILASLSAPFDFQFIDDINGRTCLHETAIAGALRLAQICIEKGVDVGKIDTYGRTALHYAAMNGHPDICHLLLQTDLSADIQDMDNYSALVYATLRGSVDCVRVLLDEGKVQIQPNPAAGDLIPFGGAQCLSNSNGEYPMHLAAREGHAEVCRLLLHHDGWDTPDKYHEWTPLFHAARYGRGDCVRILLDAGARVRATDELGHLAVYYAIWYGHHVCLSPLLAATPFALSGIDSARIPKDSPLSDSAMTDSEIDLIPSLSLPPPIMPHRVYGHNYLDKNHLVQVTIGHMSGQNTDQSGVRLHHRLISPAFRNDVVMASTPLKLVITTNRDVNSGPYSIPLPQKGAKGTYAFQISSLDNLSLVFSVYPNFGTKTIGRAVALPSLFKNFEKNRSFVLPILDTRLHVIGEVDFEVNIVTPFDGVTLEVGGDVETYWKSLAMPLASVPHRGPSRWPHRSNLIGASSAHTSPSSHSITSSSPQVSTISSLRGNYLYLIVQVTRDLHPVVCADWILPQSHFDLRVSDVTLAQFEALALETSRNVPAQTDDWPKLASSLMVSLAQLLKILPVTLGVSLELAYPQRAGLSMELVAGLYSHRSPPDVCAALNWKQPNYPVFFASQCGKKNCSCPDIEDWRTTSVGAVVEFARGNNLLGIFVDAGLLMQVPSLIDGIRNAGLLIGINGASEISEPLTSASAIEGTPVDAFVRDNMVFYVDHSMRELI
ncbi:Ankyrin repeat protein nuc-2 [Mycena sanguinolenta]|uniref:Peroxisome assembly protein 12 n=1 Tax=Mycena sanguinolenta TaxID=230812 RepID=A0A8H6Y6A6_9AGAR|nr:Ankyrin repeat protein nuc-2 [Mycena sanguinolenta]